MISIENLYYLLILLGSLLGPLSLSFDKKVSFFNKFKHSWLSIVLPAILYIAWDAVFTSMNVWSFSKKYTLGISIFGLPIEEILFFFVIPYCSLFVYEVFKCYFPNLLKSNNRTPGYLALLIIILFLSFRGFPFSQLYTSWVSISAIAIVVFLLFRPSFNNFWLAFGVAYLTVLIPKFMVNGLLTSLPVVIYNDSYFSTIRILSIPLEDFIYFLGLFLLNIMLYEYYLKRKLSNQPLV